MFWLITDDGKYRIESLSASTLPGALKVIKEDFFQTEAVCIGTEVNKNPLAGEELLELCADAALDGVSVVAVSVDTEEVVAVAFNKLAETTTNSLEKQLFEIFSEEHCKQPSSRALIDLMVEFNTQCNYFERYNIDCFCEIMFLSTLSQHRGRGLAKLICKTTLDIVKQLKKGPIAPMTIEDLGPKYALMKPRDAITKVPTQVMYWAVYSDWIPENWKISRVYQNH